MQQAQINKQHIQTNPGLKKASSQTAFFQPKLTINQPNDIYEQEADAIADKIMRMEQPFIQSKKNPFTQLQRKCAHCEEEERKMQRKEINTKQATVNNSLENYVSSLSSVGQPLSNELRNFYEPRFRLQRVSFFSIFIRSR